ncbi:MAG: acyl-homoserine-lactone synthase [Ensifer adhaerens]
MRITALRGSATDRSDAYLDQMFRLRARVFSERLGWDVTIRDGRECDTFDDLYPTYILALNDTGSVVACARLLPASGPMMVTTVFSELLGGNVLTRKHQMVESSRFCVDTAVCERGKGALHEITRFMFAGIVEWCLVNGYTEIVTATDVVVERILGRAGWPLHRLGDPRPIGQTLSVAGTLAVDRETFDRLRPSGYASDFADCRRTRIGVRT